MYDELVKRMRTTKVTVYKAEDVNLLQEAADAIEKMTEAYDKLSRHMDDLAALFPRWIPVSERLPEEHVFVLIRQDDDRMMVAERVDGDWWYRYFAYDVDRWDEAEQGTITHWMPLPQPPEELPKELLGNDMGGGIRRDDAGNVIDWGITGPPGDVGKAEEE
jgi:hypothetical protein